MYMYIQRTTDKSLPKTEHCVPNVQYREFIRWSRLAWYRTRIGRAQYSINAFITAFDFEKSC